ncbi:N-acetylmuramic acid 6-phosphate etherase [Kineococcus sp. SYSU DK006]|uniref:N-acetylmuramic acid 6-phosphate etherase n=1 Tax=Kineococcus sp. SYSU DK006 TaxID=3383127 RepID=UPI003D7C7175
MSGGRGSGRPPGEAPEDLDALTTESSGELGPQLEAMSTPELVRLVGEGDARVADAVATQREAIAAAVDAIAERMARGGRLLHVGAGTSGRLGVLDASEVPPTFGTPPGLVVGIVAGGPAALVEAVEAAEDDPAAGAAALDEAGAGPLDSVVGIAASGRTPFVLGALERAGQLGCLRVGLSCNAATPVSARSDVAIEVVVGPEVVRGSTRLRAGTATKLVLNTLSTLVMVRLGKTYGSLMVDVRATNAKLQQRALRIVATATGAADEQARAALAAADGHAGTAVAMLRLGVDAPAARAALERAGGSLARALGEL